VQRWQRSGESAQEFAAREGVRAKALEWWRWKLGREVRLPVPFVEVMAAAPVREKEGTVEVILDERLRVRVTGAFDAEVLRRTVAALGGR
jgi:transposase